MAARNGHAEVVSILLSKSTIQLHVKNKMGRTALHLAAANGHKELVSLLIGQGADINAGDEVTNLLIAKQNQFNMRLFDRLPCSDCPVEAEKDDISYIFVETFGPPFGCSLTN